MPLKSQVAVLVHRAVDRWIALPSEVGEVLLCGCDDAQCDAACA